MDEARFHLPFIQENSLLQHLLGISTFQPGQGKGKIPPAFSISRFASAGLGKNLGKVNDILRIGCRS